MIVYSYFFREIKNRFFLLLITGLSVTIISYLYKEVLLFFIYSNSPFSSYISTTITGIFSVYIKLISFINNQVLLIYFFFHLLIFLGPGLYDSEYYYIKIFLYINFCIFFFSILFFNIILFPLSCEFFLSFQHFIFKPLNFYFEAKIDDYLSFYIVMHYFCYFYFQSFIFLALIFYGLDQELKEIKFFRKLFYFLFSTFSITIIPTDLIGQILFCFSLFFLYEFVIFNFLLTKSLEIKFINN